MHTKKVSRILLALLLTTAFAGCGSDEGLGGNVTEFKTSYATAQAATPRLEVDVITGNTCESGITTGGTIVTESVDFTVNVVSQIKDTGTPLPISITGYTVTFTPKNVGAPTISDLTSNYSVPNIIPGTSVVIPVGVVTDRLKIDLLGVDPGLPCSLSIYQYDVAVKFHAAEVGSGDGSKDIVATLVVAIADRNNN